MKVLKAGLIYFFLVFGAGFALGPVRVLWVAPLIGGRAAELVEMPIMLLVIFLAARWIVGHYALPPAPAARLGMGLVALIPTLLLEFTLVLKLRGLTLTEYFAERDPVSGTVYYLMLGVFAVMPLIVERKRDDGTNEMKRKLRKS
ncbi:MAG: hypothetical protein KIT57_06325 [Blastocatellales bacterium]|nr:hypothetical protein [Blastocatellales bacterium]